jgi:hypothetical protein
LPGGREVWDTNQNGGRNCDAKNPHLVDIPDAAVLFTLFARRDAARDPG